METSDIRRLRELKTENQRLKQLYTEVNLKNSAQVDTLEKTLRPAEKRNFTEFFQRDYRMSIRGACKAVNLSRRVKYFQPVSARTWSGIGRVSMKVARKARGESSLILAKAGIRRHYHQPAAIL